MATTPSTAAVLAESARAELSDRVIARIHEFLSAVPPTVQVGRERIVGRMIIDICAEYDTRISEGLQTAEWTALGYFLTDACAGLLNAPVSHPDFTGLSAEKPYTVGEAARRTRRRPEQSPTPAG